jgi:hypothetical protein
MVVCQACMTENREDANFCSSCGLLLAGAEPDPREQSNPFGLPMGANPKRGDPRYPLIYPRPESVDEPAIEEFWAGILKRLWVPFAIAVALMAAMIFYIASR